MEKGREGRSQRKGESEGRRGKGGGGGTGRGVRGGGGGGGGSRQETVIEERLSKGRGRRFRGRRSARRDQT